jgi:hypothetical protein
MQQHHLQPRSHPTTATVATVPRVAHAHAAGSDAPWLRKVPVTHRWLASCGTSRILQRSDRAIILLPPHSTYRMLAAGVSERLVGYLKPGGLARVMLDRRI